MTKKLFLLAGLLPLLLMAKAQSKNSRAASSGFMLEGRIGHFNSPAKIYFDHMEGDIGHTDSAVLVNGVFSFAGKVNGPAAVRMAFAPKGDGKEKAIYTGDVIYFYIGAEHINIRSEDSLGNASITGSPVNDAYKAYNVFIGGSIMALNKAANDDFNRGTEELKKDTAYYHAVDRQFRQHVADRAKREMEFAKTHPHDFFSVVALMEQTQNAAGAARSKAVFATLDDSLRLSFAGKKLDEKMVALTAVVAGSMAPDFTQPDTGGKPLSLSRLQGKYVLVDFWASWCSPCRAENPNLKKQYQLYKEKGFEVISVSLDDNKKKWQDAIEKDGLPWLQVSDLKGWNNEAGKLYGISAVPSSFLVDPQGRIVATGLVGDTLNKKLAEIFGAVKTGAGAGAGVSQKIPLKILYVGYSPDRPLPDKQVYYTQSDSMLKEVHAQRMDDWKSFLVKHFAIVRTVDVLDYSAKLSDSSDVTIMDAGPVSLPANFDRPMILMHAMAPLVGMPIGLKFDWYCQCLESDALNIRTGHAIFHMPNKVNLTLVDKPTPGSFYNGFQGEHIPAVMPMWRVNTLGYITSPYLVGMVAHGEGFNDSPDAEAISGGVCLKNAEAVSLGRQGNYFMWGFSGSPEYMTEEANDVFVNVICYIKKFDHQPAIVKKVQIETREGIDELIYRIDRAVYDQAIVSRREGNRRLLRMQDSLRGRKAAGFDIGHSNEMFLKMPMTDAIESFEDYLKGYAGPELFAKFGTNTKSYHEYYRDNYEYYYPLNGYRLQLDSDAQKLAISNRKIALLEKCIGLLEAKKDTAMARRVLLRYTMERFATAAAWRNWLTENKGRLFYTESGGFKFMVNTYAAAVASVASIASETTEASLPGTGPGSADPVAVTGRLERGRIIVDADILKGWHIYAYVPKEDPFIQTEMLLDLPGGAVSDKQWESTAGLPYPGNEGVYVYEGKVRFSVAVDCSRVKPGATIKCGIYYQVCDKTKCFPPRKKTVEIKI
ncbi:redoxin family protein [Flavitalea flava]